MGCGGECAATRHPESDMREPPTVRKRLSPSQLPTPEAEKGEDSNPRREPASFSHSSLAIVVVIAPPLMPIELAALSMVQMPSALSSMLAGLFTF
jgi:hypothetical protein